MPFPFLEVAGLGANLVGSIMQAKEARRRFSAMKRAAQILQQRQDADFATAIGGLRSAQANWEADPAQASLRQMWEDRLAHPDILDAGQISLMKARAMDEAARGSEGAISAVREQAQRSGLRGSPMAVGAERAVRSNAIGRNLGIAQGIELDAAQRNRAARDATQSGYADFVNSNADRRIGFAQSIANLLGSRQYSDSALLAAM